MKFKNDFFVILFLLCFPFSPGLFAQEPPPEGRWFSERIRKDCTPLLELDLTNDQREAITEIRDNYKKELKALRLKTIEKRLGFWNMMQDPGVFDSDIRKKALELVSLHYDLQVISIEYFLAIRVLLTPEQILVWCPPLDGPYLKGRRRR